MILFGEVYVFEKATFGIYLFAFAVACFATGYVFYRLTDPMTEVAKAYAAENRSLAHRLASQMVVIRTYELDINDADRRLTAAEKANRDLKAANDDLSMHLEAECEKTAKLIAESGFYKFHRGLGGKVERLGDEHATYSITEADRDPLDPHYSSIDLKV